MSNSTTIITALKFKGGVVIGADSQVSDPVGSVRWPVEKLEPIGGHSCVVGFSGSLGRAQRARQDLNESKLTTSAFKKASTICGFFEKTLAPHYTTIQARWNKPPDKNFEVALWGLAAFWAEDSPQILELEMNGDSCLHNYFHAIGSGTNTAYAVYRTLGGRKLASLEEPKALAAILRILTTSVDVEIAGVNEPFHVWVVSDGTTRLLSDDEINTHMQFIGQWIEREQDVLFRA